ncbi:hypothetical protein GCM10011321_26260 [Youhaiella tibetensis]|uniref:Uncharacterized protein n=1 Tax=Paradevosia tibetensis TaxID=1447062 RepID=A0A5B9DJQ3_9HYPH|nr:hypothetical protein [Youhaiella tibetensis]QEE19363.1 hypothetical protein FNA67_03875 [Youhaiella tibetensis]GGF33861.1 hypothetical protein GCM10011321_26260 [Youhaiella tibetensis]
MSIHHIPDTRTDVLAAPHRATVEADGAVRTAIFAIVGIVRSVIVNRWTERRLTHLSDHMLRDFGFEREWDGTIRPLRDAD